MLLFSQRVFNAVNVYWLCGGLTAFVYQRVDKMLEFHSTVMPILLDSIVEISVSRIVLGSSLVCSSDRIQHHRTFNHLSTTENVIIC